MSEFDIYDNDFFIIDSYNLNFVKQKLYGYSIQNNDFIQDNELTSESYLSDMGAYIYVEVDDNIISLSQDFVGCYGLYLYQTKDYFAISNSFIKLVEYLKKRRPLSLNKDYADAFLFTGLCAFVSDETLINEINMLPRNLKVIINKNTKQIDYETIDYQEQSINIDSKEGIAILDKWYDKWINIIRSIRKKTNNMAFDLSGGFDTRLVSTLWLNANIDLKNIRITSGVKQVEDFKIATEISNEFNFNLNDPQIIEKKFKDLDDTLNSSFFVKLGFHKQMHYKTYVNQENFYSFTGAGGGNLRGFPNKTADKYIKGLVKYAEKHSVSLIEPTTRLAKKTLARTVKRYNCEDEYTLTSTVYKEGRNRHHFGKNIVESYLSNIITFTPLMDSQLYKLKLTTNECNDRKLLITLILSRYCPKLLEFEVEGGRKFKEDTIDYVKKINKKYPFIKKEYPFIEGPKKIKKQRNNNVKLDPNGFIKEIFYSKEFEMDFEKYYSPKIYNDIKIVAETKKHFPLTDVHSAIAIMKIIKDMEYNKYDYYPTSVDWLKTYNIDPNVKRPNYKLFESLTKFITARIDIKNNGIPTNNVEIVENSDIDSKVTNPSWFKNESGEGKEIQSTSGEIHLKLRCINEGKLRISLKGIFLKGDNDKRLPIYIKYTQFEVNNKKILKKPTIRWHDDPYHFEKNVKDNETIDVNIHWESI